jgi:hypothetical protein
MPVQIAERVRTCDLLCVKALLSGSLTHPNPQVLARSGC